MLFYPFCWNFILKRINPIYHWIYLFALLSAMNNNKKCDEFFLVVVEKCHFRALHLINDGASFYFERKLMREKHPPASGLPAKIDDFWRTHTHTRLSINTFAARTFYIQRHQKSARKRKVSHLHRGKLITSNKGWWAQGGAAWRPSAIRTTSSSAIYYFIFHMK